MKAPIHLNALRAFEASARHQSFSGAAVELHVTSAAVGQMVRGLEEYLGCTLFHRSASGAVRLVPTELAQRALPELRAGFDHLSAALSRLQEVETTKVLTVTVSPAFAAKWLLPKIDRFQAAYPDIDLRLDTTLKLLDFAAQGIDVGVRYGRGVWPGLTTEKLFDEEIYPVCAASFRRKNPELRTPSGLAGLTLIHDLSMESQPGVTTWPVWLNTAGVPNIKATRGLRINNSAAVVQAAIDGHGVALGRSVMVKDDLTSGRLVRLFPLISCPAEFAYYVVYRSELASHKRLNAFVEWLKLEAQL